MPTYDYHCEANQQTITLQHGMKERIITWGDLCRRAGLEPGATPLETRVERLITGGLHLPIARPEAPAPSGGCCGQPSSCQHHH